MWKNLTTKVAIDFQEVRDKNISLVNDQINERNQSMQQVTNQDYGTVIKIYLTKSYGYELAGQCKVWSDGVTIKTSTNFYFGINWHCWSTLCSFVSLLFLLDLNAERNSQKILFP